MQYGSIMGHAPANLAFVAVLTSSFALLAFSKYWRAQITPIIDPYCIIRFTYWFFTVLHFAGYRQVSGSDYPDFRIFIAKKILYDFDFTVRFSVNKKSRVGGTYSTFL